MESLNSKDPVTVGDTVTLKFRVKEAIPSEVLTEWYYIPDPTEDDSNKFLNPIMISNINSPGDVNITLQTIGLKNSSFSEGRYYMMATNIVGSVTSHADVTFINLGKKLEKKIR